MISSQNAGRHSVDVARLEPDRRLMPRVACRILAKAYFAGTPDGLLGQARDLGVGGVCIETAMPFPLETLRRVSLEIEGRTLVSKAAARWQRNAPGRTGVLTGLQFVDVTTAQIELLKNYTHRCASELAAFLCERAQLGAIPEEDARELALFTRFVHFSAGSHLYRRGSNVTRGDSAFILQRGKIALEARVRGGGLAYQEHIGEGAVFGAMPLLGAMTHPESAVAECDVLALEIDAYCYRHLEAARPHALRWVTQALVRRYAAQIEALIQRATAHPRAEQ